MKLAQIWRFPVKSMAGEALDHATITPLGIQGDRIVHVEDFRGRFITSRTHHKLLGHHAKLGPDGQPLVDGLPWTDPQVLRHVVDIVGPGAKLVHNEEAYRFDILPLLVATDGAIEAFGHDSRRLRPNLVIGGVDGLDERSWPRKMIQIGSVQIGVQNLRGRCVMTTFDPDTLVQNKMVLKEIVDKFEGKLALNCFVIQGGQVKVGDTVEIADMPAGIELPYET